MQSSVSKGFGSVVRRPARTRDHPPDPSPVRLPNAPGSCRATRFWASTTFPSPVSTSISCCNCSAHPRQHPARLVIRRQGTAGLSASPWFRRNAGRRWTAIYRIDDGTRLPCGSPVSRPGTGAEQLRRRSRILGGTEAASARARRCAEKSRRLGPRRGSKPHRCFSAGTRLLSIRARSSDPRTSTCRGGAAYRNSSSVCW